MWMFIVAEKAVRMRYPKLDALFCLQLRKRGQTLFPKGVVGIVMLDLIL